MKESFKFVGYWNGDQENPIITKDLDIQDKNKKLCIISIEEIPDAGHMQGSHDITVQKNKLSKLNREIKNLTKATKRLK